MTEYTLFCAPNTYAMSAHAILEEVGANYNLHWVELFSDQPDPLFIAASPHGRTPALNTPEGTIFETGAVSLYIAEKFPQFNLYIPTDHPKRGKFLQWFHYLATTLQPEVLIQFHPESYYQDEVQQKALKNASMKRLIETFETLEFALMESPFLFGSQPMVPDYILAMQTIWDEIFPTGIGAFPNLKQHLDLMKERPAVQRMLDQHQVEQRHRNSSSDSNQ